MQPERPLHIVKAWLHQVYFGNLAFKPCEVSKSELFTTECCNRSKAQNNPSPIFSNQEVMWAKKWACISHPWNHKQQKQNTDESITFFSNQEVMWAKVRARCSNTTTLEKNRRQLEDSVENQFCFSWSWRIPMNNFRCVRNSFFLNTLLCANAKKSTSLQSWSSAEGQNSFLHAIIKKEDGTISDSQFPSIVSRIIYIPSKQTAGIDKQYTNCVTNSRSLSYGFSLSTPMACKFVFPMEEEEDLRQVFIQARAQTLSPQFQRDIQVSIN